ncbi:hypothetical protein J8I26_15455 [Herbaspirillum sp. LeCh32-8]|uniref:hypothetical protein n=1 Tax=Herbaspirillum sp. LeCh32-8 TaxID=2821356 RepID=UPI001AE3EA23|nr:hypothetical protein [Herbaspirillum sp. LeCh32-8]MBP0599513.1 hypothetical protein [Herbaspirillum sp. LeCh32-8]
MSCSLTAQADTLRVQVPAQYADNAPVMDRIRDECAVEEMVGNYVFRHVSRKYPDALQASDPAELNKGRVLKLTILSVQGVGGGGWSGAKAILVHGDLMQDGQVVRTAVQRDHSRGGMLGGMRGTCSILEIVAESLGKQFTAWLVRMDGVQPSATPLAAPAVVTPADMPAAASGAPQAQAETPASGGNVQSAP